MKPLGSGRGSRGHRDGEEERRQIRPASPLAQRRLQTRFVFDLFGQGDRFAGILIPGTLLLCLAPYTGLRIYLTLSMHSSTEVPVAPTDAFLAVLLAGGLAPYLRSQSESS